MPFFGQSGMIDVNLEVEESKTYNDAWLIFKKGLSPDKGVTPIIDFAPPPFGIFSDEGVTQESSLSLVTSFTGH